MNCTGTSRKATVGSFRGKNSSNPSTPSKNNDSCSDKVPHIVRLTFLGISGLSVNKNWDEKPRENMATKISTSDKINPFVPDPEHLRAFLTLSSNSSSAAKGLKISPTFTRTHSLNVDDSTDTVEMAHVPPAVADHGDRYHMVWTEGRNERGNVLVFETGLNRKKNENDMERPTDIYEPKTFNINIGLVSDSAADTSIESIFGTHIGQAPITITGAESWSPYHTLNLDASKRIFRTEYYLPISNVAKGNDSKTLDPMKPVPLKSSTKMRSRGIPKRDDPKFIKPSSRQIKALHSKYKFQEGDGILFVAIEVYKKGSEQEKRARAIRQVIKMTDNEMNDMAIPLIKRNHGIDPFFCKAVQKKSLEQKSFHSLKDLGTLSQYGIASGQSEEQRARKKSDRYWNPFDKKLNSDSPRSNSLADRLEYEEDDLSDDADESTSSEEVSVIDRSFGSSSVRMMKNFSNSFCTSTDETYDGSSSMFSCKADDATVSAGILASSRKKATRRPLTITCSNKTIQKKESVLEKHLLFISHSTGEKENMIGFSPDDVTELKLTKSRFGTARCSHDVQPISLFSKSPFKGVMNYFLKCQSYVDDDILEYDSMQENNEDDDNGTIFSGISHINEYKKVCDEQGANSYDWK